MWCYEFSSAGKLDYIPPGTDLNQLPDLDSSIRKCPRFANQVRNRLFLFLEHFRDVSEEMQQRDQKISSPMMQLIKAVLCSSLIDTMIVVQFTMVQYRVKMNVLSHFVIKAVWMQMMSQKSL